MLLSKSSLVVLMALIMMVLIMVIKVIMIIEGNGNNDKYDMGNDGESKSR